MKTIPEFLKRKAAGQPITMVTCYDAAVARILNKTSVDVVLVGDSCAMVVHGFESTVHATVEMMAVHTAAARRGAPDKVIVADLPFLSYRGGLDASIEAVATLMRAGANAVKLERGRGNLDLIRHLVEGGVPVMGHLGLTPQAVNELGGHKMQARNAAKAKLVADEAMALQEAGCFSVVLECIPGRVAKDVTESLDVPTIGIGCGPDVSGQVLVINDLLGVDGSFAPKFVRKYANLSESIGEAVEAYCADTRDGTFPATGEFTA